MSLVLSSAYFTGLCIISLYFVNALSLPTFNAFFPSSVSKVCLFCAGYVTLDTWPSVTLWKPPWSQENHASYLIPHLVLFWSSEHTKCKQKQPQSSERHAYFHRIPSVLVQEQENCFDLQTGFPVFVAPFLGGWLYCESTGILQERLHLFLPCFLPAAFCSI